MVRCAGAGSGCAFGCRGLGSEGDLGGMFEGAVRSIDSWPATWWLGWMALAFLAGGVRWANPTLDRRMRWAWTDVRLLFQERGDGSGLTLVDAVVHIGAGAAAALSLSGLMARSAGGDFSHATFLRLWALWFLMSGMRWCVGRLMDGVTGLSGQGTAWTLHHRWVTESAAWWLAPLGLLSVVLDPSAARGVLLAWGGLWAIGWAIRQQRTTFSMSSFKKHPLIAMLYLCALEILPVAVLFRAWQG